MKKEAKKYMHRTIETGKELLKHSDVFYQDFEGTSKLGDCPRDVCIIVLFEEGGGFHIVNATKFPVSAKQIHIQIPEQSQKWELDAITKGLKLIMSTGLVKSFSSKLQHLFTVNNTHTVILPDTAMYKKIHTECLAIKKELSSNTVFIELVHARARLITLMINLWLEHKYGTSVDYMPHSMYYKFHALVEQHYKDEKNVSFYAQKLHITANYLAIICKRHYKMSPSSFIQERVLLEAKKLLHSSQMPIGEIAVELGFKSLSYFTYFFKLKTHLTPKKYRVLIEGA